MGRYYVRHLYSPGSALDMLSTLSKLGISVLASLWLAGCSSTFGPAAQGPSGGAQQAPVPAASNDSGSTDDPVLVSVSTDNYELGEGDQIAIQVFDEPDLTMDARVGASGAINYSYLGDVKVAGKTAVQLEQHITGLLRNGYLVNPSVNVTVSQYRPFFIGGEVRSPGSYPYQPGLTLNKAIALAGGLTDRASSRRMFIAKPTGEEFRASPSQDVAPGDIISIREGFF